MTPDQLAQIQRRADAATEGPWHSFGTGPRGGDHWYVIGADNVSLAWGIASRDGENEAQRGPDAEFIAHARTDIPGLLAAVRDAQQSAEQAEQALTRVRTMHQPDPNDRAFCVSCDRQYPCPTAREIPTARALDGGQQEEAT